MNKKNKICLNFCVKHELINAMKSKMKMRKIMDLKEFKHNVSVFLSFG